MANFLDILVRDVKRTIRESYYNVTSVTTSRHISLKKAILEFDRAPIIAEIKFASPINGIIRKDLDVERIASTIVNNGAIAISVLTEPKHFLGSLNIFSKVRKKVELPLLMKDIIISHVQVDAASMIGADAVLLIKTLFDCGYCKFDISDMIQYVHSKGMEILLETHTKNEFLSALNTEADMIGINNRNLKTLKVDINTTRRILQKLDSVEKVVVSESGIKTVSDIQFLHTFGVKAFLIGSEIMLANDLGEKVKEFVTAL